jgi:M3 family oligoendopeptidase
MQHFNSDFDQLKDIEIETPDKDEIINQILKLDDRLVHSSTAKEALEVIYEYFSFHDDFSTIISLVNFHHTINTADEKYNKLQDLLDEILPSIEEAINKIGTDIYESPFKPELEKDLGHLYFEQVKLSNKTFSSEIIDDLVEENKEVSSYVKLLASAKIEFEGKTYSLSQMGQFTTSLNRTTRIAASKKTMEFFETNDEKIGAIYDSMIKTRNRIAKKLGYDDFVQLGYDRMGRLDWNKDDAKEYRERILKYLVPLSIEIHKAQKDRLGYGDDTRSCDYNIFYKSGNPKPKGTPDDLIDAAKKMYGELSPVASKYFNFMVDHGCMDILAKENKAGGGYMDYIPSLKTSLIFSNFNGTSGDVDVLTHEFGHALQGFLGAEETDVPAYRCPGMECAEMHSMSMEYLTYPWMHLFFKEDTDKYLYMHLCDAITFIPYGCIVDGFQTYCYEHPEMTHQERKAYWRKLELEYLPHREYKDSPFLASGGYWERQAHIFENPLYYLDYTIAQVVSLEFFIESQEDHKKAFDKYLAFDRLGGKYPFRELLKKAGIRNPLDGDTLKDVSNHIFEYLKTFDLSKLDK